jgi:hypothetical protein
MESVFLTKANHEFGEHYSQHPGCYGIRAAANGDVLSASARG